MIKVESQNQRAHLKLFLQAGLSCRSRCEEIWHICVNVTGWDQSLFTPDGLH